MSEVQDLPNIRELRDTDDFDSLTRLVHAAYASQAARGLRFWGTHQSIDDTAKRFASGQGFVAEFHGEYVGTVIARPPQPNSPVALYREPNTWAISQLAVAPALKGRGLGKALHRTALRHAEKNGGVTMALDTAAPGTGLIAMYQSWGYQIVGHHDWRPHTNYLSVLMSRPVIAA